MGDRGSAYRILVARLLRKGFIGRFRHGLEDNIKMGLQ